ncbi:MAG: DUF2599 domain-containing protein [Propionibacteriaceae bacterium]|nr:DUF2599 domain-containing protein [Propionibacteriaceae bacterium]
MDGVADQQILDNVNGSIPEIDSTGSALVAETSVTDSSLPENPTDPITLESASGIEISLSLPHSETSSEALPVSSGILSYDNNQFKTVPVVKDDGSVQVNTIINSPEAPDRYPYNVSIPDDGTPSIGKNGEVVFTSSTGQFLGGITPPWAKDANGKSLPTWYEIEGYQITQVVDHSGLDVAYPVVADPWLGVDLFSYTGYNRKGGYLGQMTVSAKLSAWGWSWYLSSTGGMLTILNDGWDELVSKRPQAASKPTLRHQYECHVAFGAAVWLAGQHWDLEKARPDKPGWLTSALDHKCNW